MRVYKTRLFARFARREKIGDRTLLEAADRVGRGLIDADLGGGLIKQRVARPGQGRRGGYRVLIAFRAEDRLIFLLGFAKNQQANIDGAELINLRVVSGSWLTASTLTMEAAKAEGLLVEVQHDD